MAAARVLRGVAALSLLAACAPAFTTTCRSNDECPADSRCDLQSATCVAAGVDAGDAAVADHGNTDTARPDATRPDAASAELPGTDSTTPDGSPPDTAASDAARTDTRMPDTGSNDTSARDTGVADTSARDTRVADTSVRDTRVADTRAPDTYRPDNVAADSAQPDAVPCLGCTIGNSCYAWMEHNPANPCEWCAMGRPHQWTRITGPVCSNGTSCWCDNGVINSGCNGCLERCDPYDGTCCGSLGEPCCMSQPRCRSGLQCGFMTETCGSIVGCGAHGDICCADGTCNSAQDYCCNGTCIPVGWSCID